MLLKVSESRKVELDGFSAFLYNSKADSPHVSAVLVDCFSHHSRVVVPNSIRLYFVVEGSGEFNVGKERYTVSHTDLVIVPAGTPYSYTGRMRLFEVNTPATDASDETSA